MAISILEGDIRRGVELLGEYLSAHSLTITTAESCTGGSLSEAITSVAGSSAWFEFGFVTYANRAKINLLGVPKTLLDTHGAVSAEVAAAMAEGAAKEAYADIGVAITGIAGPGGGTPDKPVGTVFVSWTLAGGNTVTEYRMFRGDRATVRQQSVVFAVSHLIDLLIKQPKR